MRTTHRPAVPALLAATLLTVAACSGGDDDASGESATGEDGLIPVTISTQPIVDSAPLYLGVDQGFYEEEGIDLTIENASGGAAVIPSVVSGEHQFGRGNLLSTMIARDQGLDLECIANANSAQGVPDFSAILTAPDSGIESPADLEGHTVSINNLNNIGEAIIRTAIERDGGDPSLVDFVELGFAEVPQAIESGQIEAGWAVEPFVTEALDLGQVAISWPFYEFHEDLDISCVFTSGQVLEEDPELVAAFQRATDRALEFADANPDEVRRITGTYTEIDESVLERMVLPRFTPEMSREAAEFLAEKALEYGMLTNEPDLDALLP
jgi:NitT/TauT family transport system substrate-binding protein